VGMTEKSTYETASSVLEPSEGLKPSEGLLFHCHSRANGNPFSHEWIRGLWLFDPTFSNYQINL